MTRFMVAAQSHTTIERWRDAKPAGLDVAFFEGPPAKRPDDCDAEIMPGFMAYDRYGGTPVAGQSQVLANFRNDSAPKFIVATPPYAPTVGRVDKEIADRKLFDMFHACMNAITSHNNAGKSKIEYVLIVADALGLEGIPHDVVSSSFFRAAADI
ncbi:hypothetical protein [Nocardia sp. SSK8]|uniref:hypothetical protein n=1 Tax=Nocardia sp. SSK8 TaxID=3120154 RepID=UPI0030083319